MAITLPKLQQKHKLKFKETLMSSAVIQQFIEMPSIPHNSFLAAEWYKLSSMFQ